MNQANEFAGHLLAFYDEHARELPFRISPRPYYTWISEIMLQQTRMDTVIPYFNRFIDQLPDIAALAAVPDERLLKLWEGLGYYSRARNLKKAAEVIVADHGGIMPQEYEELVKLPGIGPYTAGAIASIAFGKAVPAVDGNVIRVFSRLEAYGEPVMTARGKSFIFQAVEAVISRERPGDFNQAIMELGATVCLPNGAPLCQRCPVSEHCLALQQGDPLAFPLMPEKKARRREEHTVLLLVHNGKFLAQQRPEEGLLAGLWQVPMRQGILAEEDVIKWIHELGFPDFILEMGGKAKHIFSHVEWHMQSFAAHISNQPNGECLVGENPAGYSSGRAVSAEGYSWIPGDELDVITLPTAFRKFREAMGDFLEKSGNELGS